jgi:hypothetical protein
VQTFTATRFRLHLVETASIKMSKSQRQAGRKSAAEENGKRREENILRAKREENGTGRRQQFQTAIITPFSAWRSHHSPGRIESPHGTASRVSAADQPSVH